MSAYSYIACMKPMMLFLLFLSFGSIAQNSMDVQGHRGARGLFPENSIYGFIEAVKLGVTTLEMDVVVSKDGQLVVSHDPYMNPDICRDGKGRELKEVKERYNIYGLTYAEIKTFDCGSYGNPKFAEQQKIAVYKPLLKAVIDSVENYIAANNLPKVRYNIETKSTESGDDKFHPKPAAFSRLLYDLLQSKRIADRCIIQSFDVRTLQQMRSIDSTMQIALLVFNTFSYEKNLEILGFKPQIYSPNYLLLNRKLAGNCRRDKIKLVPWTINDKKKIKKAIAIGVDGIISDYPDRVISALPKKK
jgi:glycerophosphoryl diester phosphodiesterase